MSNPEREPRLLHPEVSALPELTPEELNMLVDELRLTGQFVFGSYLNGFFSECNVQRTSEAEDTIDFSATGLDSPQPTFQLQITLKTGDVADMDPVGEILQTNDYYLDSQGQLGFSRRYYVQTENGLLVGLPPLSGQNWADTAPKGQIMQARRIAKAFRTCLTQEHADDIRYALGVLVNYEIYPAENS